MRQPRLRSQSFGFKRLDFVAVAQGQTNVVKAVDQAVFAEGLHLKRPFHTVGFDDDLALQINRQAVGRESGALVKQLGDLRFAQNDGQQAIFEAIVEENIGIAGRDDGSEAILVQRPRCVLARRAATEVFPSDQNAGARITRLVQHEIWVGFAAGRVLARVAIVKIAPSIKQMLAKTGFADGFEKLLGDDRVSVDVFAVHRGDQAFVYGEFLHK